MLQYLIGVASVLIVETIALMIATAILIEKTYKTIAV